MPFSVRFRRLTCISTVSLACTVASTAALGQSVLPAVFVCHNIATNPNFNNYAAVSSFTIDVSGNVTYVGNYFTNDNPQAIAVSPNGRFLAVTHGTASSTFEDLLVFRVEPDASLTMWAVFSTPNSPLDVEWISNDVVAATETRDGGVNRIHAYRLVENNPVATRLSLIDSEETGVFTAYIARHPSGDFLYVSDSALGGASLKVRAFTVNTDDTLTFLSDTNLTSYPLDLAISNDGTKLYSAGGIGLLSGGDPHRIHGFDIAADGIPVVMGTSPFHSSGQSPAHVAITGNDRILLAGHGGDGDVHSFLISDEDGFLTETGFEISVGGQGDIGAIAALGSTLFATRRYSSTGNPSGLLQYRVGADGSFEQVGGVIDTHGTASDAIDVWLPTAVAQGDINDDGNVDELDVAALVAVLLGMPQAPEHVARSDFNGDSAVDGRDLELFVGYFLNPVSDGACCNPDGACEIITQAECAFGGPGATWLGPNTLCENCPDPAPVINQVFSPPEPTCNTPGQTIFISVQGDHFSPQVEVVLRQAGQPDVAPLFINVFGDDFLDAEFPVGGMAPGDWFLFLSNPDGQSDTWPTPIVIIDCN
ncbi:MAG TPA: dockerin type I domain-containing protein [Phycisphaerae bacterium]|nr:dockerin type I domain-containing protein [Phycisphaerae bacterium]